MRSTQLGSRLRRRADVPAGRARRWANGDRPAGLAVLIAAVLLTGLHGAPAVVGGQVEPPGIDQRTNCGQGRGAADAGPMAGPFPGRGNDLVYSLGKFMIVIDEPFQALMDSFPGYDQATARLLSPVLRDVATTVIGRSAPHLDGSAEDSGGVPVGAAGTIVSDADLVVPPGFEEQAGTREIHTLIQSLRLVDRDMSVAVRAGAEAPDRPQSPGEVKSQSPTGVPADDFPGRSFFNVYAEVDLPRDPGNIDGFPGATLYNAEPLIVVNEDLDRFPPRVVYGHENAAAVPALFKVDDPGGRWRAGDRFGWLALAGHGVCFDANSAEIAEFEAQLGEQELMPTPSPTPTMTSTPTSTATPTFTPTPTPTPRPAYLPLVLKERCDVQERHADVALAIDVSGSMAGEKFESARRAARTFVDLMALGDGSDQVAAVAFDAAAVLAAELTADRGRVREAIDGLRVGSGTAIDAGLRVARAELTGVRHVPGNSSVIVLLSDGAQTGGPAAALAAAAEVRAAGIELYAIGVGDADAETLRAMAGDPGHYFFAPAPADLERIYADVAGDIKCPAEAFWPNRR